MAKHVAHTRDQYRHIQAIATRWMDNDVYGHVNNVVYYSYFDTVVNAYLIRAGALDIARGAVIGVVVETSCQYFRSITFPDIVHAGLRVARLGNSSVRYDVAIFRNDEDTAAAQGHFIHVYVQRDTRQPTALPLELRAALAPLVVPDQE